MKIDFYCRRIFLPGSPHQSPLTNIHNYSSRLTWVGVRIQQILCTSADRLRSGLQETSSSAWSKRNEKQKQNSRDPTF